MNALEEARYRLILAEGFVGEAREDMSLRRWRSCVDNSQLAVENAAKVALALLGPVAQVHEPAPLLRKALAEGRFPSPVRTRAEGLAQCSERLGADVHIEVSYGNEEESKTPWELFGETEARGALHVAEEAVRLAKEVIQHASVS
ncbi:MAG: HEPN domain-containing protein [Planctomycetes bacterium]|nr:HEPN domain-containing protein [Planctomycetota bacterium]